MNAASRGSGSDERREQSASRPIHAARANAQQFEGRVLGGFSLTREIASGGMAAVYLAHRAQHARIGQTAAVKLIHPHLARDEDFVEMFLDEARIASCISHPNVCRVLDFGISEGTYYLAMEYVMGETLADVFARVSSSPEADKVATPLLLQIIAQACEGLHAAHEARDPQGKSLNIVHRDISPQNIMVGYDGSVRVLDFGVASASERLHSTRNGKIKGRLAYMAPEQMNALPIDRRADVWSLGVVLWEGLAGKRLFKRDDEIKTIIAVTRDPLPSLADCGREVPTSLQAIVGRALTRDREARYRTARDLGLALSRSAMTSLQRAGMPELSVWMQSLFGERIERKRALLRAAADAAEASARSAAPATSTTREVSIFQEAGDGDAADVTRIAVPRLQPHRANPISGIRPKKRRSRTRSILTLVTMLLLAVPTPCRAPGSERILGHASVPLDHSLVPSTTGAYSPQSAPIVEHPAAQPTALPATKIDLLLAPLPAQPAAEQPPIPAAALPAQPAADKTLSPAPPARKAPAGVVTVVTTSGWADVYAGPRKLGSTPLRVWLPAGVRYLRLVPFGKGPGLLRRVAVSGSGQATQMKVAIE